MQNMEQFLKYYTYYFVFVYLIKSACMIKFDVSLMVQHFDIRHCEAHSGVNRNCSVKINLKSGKDCPSSGTCCENCKSSNCFCSGDSPKKVYTDNPDEGMNLIMVEVTVCPNNKFLSSRPDFMCRKHQLKDTVNEMMYANHSNGNSFRFQLNIKLQRDTTSFQTSEASSSGTTIPTDSITTSLIKHGVSLDTAQSLSNRTLHQGLLTTSLIGHGVSMETSSSSQSVSNRTLHQGSITTSLTGHRVSLKTSSPAQSASNKTPHQGNNVIIIGCVIGSVVVIGIIILVPLLLKCKKNRQIVESGDKNRQKFDANQHSSTVNESKRVSTENQEIIPSTYTNGFPPSSTLKRLAPISSSTSQNSTKYDAVTLDKAKKSKRKKAKEKKKEIGDVDNKGLPVSNSLAHGSNLEENEDNAEQNNDTRKSKRHKKKNKHKSFKDENFEGNASENDFTNRIQKQQPQYDSNKACNHNGLTNDHGKQMFVSTEQENGQHTLKANENENEYNLKKRNNGKKEQKKRENSNELGSNAHLNGNIHGGQNTDPDVAFAVLNQQTSGVNIQRIQDGEVQSLNTWSNINNEGNIASRNGDEQDGGEYKHRKNKSKKGKKARKTWQVDHQEQRVDNNNGNNDNGIPVAQDYELGNHRDININATLESVGEKQEEIAEYLVVDEQSVGRKKKKKKKKKRTNATEQQYVNNNEGGAEY